MKKRCMSILLAFCMAWTLFPASTLAETSDGDAVPIIAEADATSTDETSAESAVLSDAGDALTRGAWMRELVNLFGLTLTKDEYPDVYFPDIGESDYFDAIMIATKYGFVDVDAGENFEPDNPITREFAVHTLNFYLGIQNDRDGFTFSDSDKTEYPDDAQVALDIEWLSAVDGKFSPEEIVTAEESSEMLRKAKEIHDSRTASNPVSNYEFADYVKTIPESVDVDSDIDYDTGIRTLTISGYQETLAKGDTFVYYYEGLAFVLTAEKVDERDGVLTVVTTDPPSDAIVKYEFAGVIQPEIIEAVPVEEPVTLQCADGDTVTFGPVELLAVTKYGPIEFNRDVFKSNGVKGTLSGKIDNIKLDTAIFSKDKHIRLTGDVTATCSVEFDLLNDPAAKSLNLCGFKLKGLGYVGLELNLKWEAKFGFTYIASFEFGASYENGHGSSTSQWNASDDSCFFADGTFSAQLQLSARLHIDPFINVDASIGAGPIMKAGFKQYAGGTPRQCVTMSGYLYAGIKFDAKVKDPDGKVVWENPKKSFDLYNEKNSPVRLYTHAEDGVEVPSCTRGKDSGTTTGTYRTPKYTTPSNSRYYARNNANASSTGYGGYGSTEPVVIWQTSDNGDGTVTITGYSGNASILNIPETIDGKAVTKIGNGAFQNNTAICMVNIPDSVTSVYQSAFANCAKLSSVTFSKNLTEIGEYAFCDTALTTAELPEGLLYLGRMASVDGNGGVFYNCGNLESVYIPNTSLVCGSFTGNFQKCDKLNNVTFGEGIAAIPPYLFYNCSGLTHIEIPDTVTGIGGYAFSSCSNLTHIEIPDSVTSVYKGAFRDCAKLSSVTFSKNLTEIGEYAFCDTALTTAELPEGLLYLGRMASVDGNGGVFYNCGNLESVYIPNTSLVCGSFTGNFQKCDKLNNVTFGEGIAAIPAYLFYRCSGLTHIEIPDTVESVYRNAFCECANLATVHLPDSVTAIGSYAFSGCSNLTHIELPDSVTSVYQSAFANCAKLSSVTFSKNLTEIGEYAFCDTALTTAELPEGLLYLGRMASVDGNGWVFSNCGNLESVYIPNTVTEIKDNTFNGCSSLKSALLPETVTRIGYGAFKGCTNLTSLKSGSKLKTIGANCFQDCVALTDVDLANGLTSIGTYAFQNCAALETIVLPDSVTSIGTYVFQKDAALKNVTLSSGLTQIPSYAFANCTSMTELEIPGGVTTIKDHAFYQDTKLKTFVIPASVSKIEDNAFSYPTTTTVYGVPGSYAETYAKWAAFLDIAQYCKTGTMGDAQELQWTYDPGGKTVTVTGAVNASAPVYVGSYDANGKMLSVKLITASNGAAQADDGANTVILFWLDSNFMPKCGKATIRNA